MDFETTGNEDSDIGGKVALWDEEGGGMRDRDGKEVDLSLSRIHLPPSQPRQDASDNIIPYSHGSRARSLAPGRDGEVGSNANSGQGSRSLAECRPYVHGVVPNCFGVDVAADHHARPGQSGRPLVDAEQHRRTMVPDLVVHQGNMNTHHLRPGNTSWGEQRHQGYPTEPSPQTWGEQRHQGNPREPAPQTWGEQRHQRYPAEPAPQTWGEQRHQRYPAEPAPQTWGEQRHQSYPTEPAPQTWGARGSLTKQPVPVIPSSHPQHGSSSDQDSLHMANPDHSQMGPDDNWDGDGIERDQDYNRSQFSSHLVSTLGSSIFFDSSSGYHTSRTSEPLQEDRRNYRRSGRSAVGQVSAGHGEAVSSFSGHHGQEYLPPDMDGHDFIPPHCRIDSIGPPLKAIPKKKPKTPKSSRSGTSSRNVDQVIYQRGTGGEAGMEQPPSSQAAPDHVRSSHGDREVITTNTRRKQRKKSKEKPYPAEVDDNKRKKMEGILPMFTERVDPNLLQQHLRGCLKDEQCEHISQLSVGRVKPRKKINQELWKYIQRAPYWWQNLERALEECGYNDLLAKLREA
ncbi:uncharacterized protein [Haliotis cracherodii]|uniref:uncharacterized protein n=1 Tax=Haliotis cracherodii TaxID=6455 RepID=UPI0039ECA53E